MPEDLPYKNCKLVSHYFGRFIEKLLEARQRGNEYAGRFYLIADNPENLEARLQKIEGTELVRTILSEVGLTEEVKELDRRLMDAWAEIRFIDLLVREGFDEIKKVTAIADFCAIRDDRSYAFQVKRINSSLSEKVQPRNPKNERDTSTHVTVDNVYERLANCISDLFWDALLEKNGKYKKWVDEGTTKCIVIISGDQSLQDRVIRHICCKEIVKGTFDPAIVRRHFDQLIWLPDLGYGALFIFGDSTEDTICLADWHDEYGRPEGDRVRRRKVNLSSGYPDYLDE